MLGRFQQIVNYHIAQAVGLPAVQFNAIITVKGLPLTVFRVHSVIHSGNFLNDITTLTYLTVMIPFSQMRIAATAANGDLRVQLIIRTANRHVATIPYRGIVVNNRNPDMESQTMFVGQSDSKSIALITLELMDETIWFQRLLNVSVSYKETDALTVARAILADTMTNMEGQTGDQVQSIDYEEEEQQKYKSIILPDSVEFLEVFDLLQKRYGIYSKGLGVYQHLRRWYLFKPYDRDKFSSATNKLVIYNLPRERSAHIDKTTHITPGVVYLITGGDTNTHERVDQDALNVGTGYRAASIRALDGKSTSYSPGEISNTIPSGYISAANPIQYPGKMTNAKVIKERFTDNDKPYLSNLAKTRGTITKVTWNRSTHGLITPGMAVKYVYANDYGIYEKVGTVLGEVFQAGLDGGAMATARYNSQTELTLWLADKNTEAS